MGKQQKTAPSDGPGEQEEQRMIPLNPDSEERAQLPDPDRTEVQTETDLEDVTLPLQSEELAGEHSIGPDHAEPTDVTETTNDDYIDGKLIDVGGGD